MSAPNHPTPHPNFATVAPFGFNFDAPRFLAAYRTIGCTHAQVYANADDMPTTKHVIDTVTSAGLAIDSIHGVFSSNIDPSSPDRNERDRCLAIYEREGQWAKDLGGPIVVVHPAAVTPMREDFTPTIVYSPAEAGDLQKLRWPHLIDFLRRLADIGERLGVTYAIENLSFNVPLGHDPRALAGQLRELGSARVRMCFDTGHAQVTTGDAASALRDCANVVAYMHVHDARDGHAHVMPHEGEADWGAIARVIAERCVNVPRMLELFVPEEQIESLTPDEAGALRAACAVTQERA
jgi:hydroxypyruvate isomerase